MKKVHETKPTIRIKTNDYKRGEAIVYFILRFITKERPYLFAWKTTLFHIFLDHKFLHSHINLFHHIALIVVYVKI